MKLQDLVAGGEVFAMETVEVSSRPGESGTQSCGNQQSHVKFDYWKQPRCSSGGGDQEGRGGTRCFWMQGVCSCQFVYQDCVVEVVA